MIVPKQITHHFDVVVASVVQARQPESRLERLEQRKAVVKPVALNAFLGDAVGLDGEDDLVLILRWEQAAFGAISTDAAVIILIPDDYDGGAAANVNTGECC